MVLPPLSQRGVWLGPLQVVYRSLFSLIPLKAHGYSLPGPTPTL